MIPFSIREVRNLIRDADILGTVLEAIFVLLIDSVDWLPADVTLVDKIKSNP